jgi:alkylated DNA nucleotide flippase Atl1
MNTDTKDTAFHELVTEALKKMQEAGTTPPYEIIRSDGMITIQRTGYKREN